MQNTSRQRKPEWMVLALLLLAASASAQSRQERFDFGRLAAIPAKMQQAVDQGELTGIVTLIADRDAIVQVSTAGFQDHERRIPMRAETIFQIMSMTKPLTASGILLLAEEGRLSINDPVEKYLPEFCGQVLKAGDSPSGVRKPARAITVRDVLTHTSGMDELLPRQLPDLYVRWHLNLSHAVSLFAQQPLVFEPGSRWMYSNMGMATLGRLIEIVSGSPYEKFMSDRILRPLGMSDSYFFLPVEARSRLAAVKMPASGKLTTVAGDALGGDEGRFRLDSKYPAPEFGMYSTARDVTRFYQMMLNGGVLNGRRVMSRAFVELATTVHTGALPCRNPGVGWGLGWEVVNGPAGMQTLCSAGTFRHGGVYGTYAWIDPKRNLIGVFLTQASIQAALGAREAFMQMAASSLQD